MGTVNITGSNLGNALQSLLLADDIVPGSDPSYQLAKTIYLYHPLGAKLTELPIKMAQSQPRTIAIPIPGLEDRIRQKFVDEWKALGADGHILATASLGRCYGIAAVAVKAEGVPDEQPVDYKKLWQQTLTFNVYDPLNVAGSLVLDQDPNAMDFQHVVNIAVAGRAYHRSRSCVFMNERPIYIAFTSSAFGFVGRSVYQRVLFPLKSFVQTLVTDDMVVRKAGVLVAMLKAAGSIIDNVMQTMFGVKRNLIKEAETNNVISVGSDDKIETLNMQNLDGAYGLARKNILENIAAGADDMPAKLLNAETFAEGFGEGTEDAKHVAAYIDRIREQLGPLYAFFTEITMYRAWNPEFFKLIQGEFPTEMGNVSYNEAFYKWKNAFSATWPSLITEPPSEEIKVDDVKLKAAIALLQVLAPMMDPESLGRLIEWAADQFNELKVLFPGSPLMLDTDAIIANAVEKAEQAKTAALEEPSEPKPFAAADSQPAVTAYHEAVDTLLSGFKERADRVRGQRRAA